MHFFLGVSSNFPQDVDNISTHDDEGDDELLAQNQRAQKSQSRR